MYAGPTFTGSSHNIPTRLATALAQGDKIYLARICMKTLSRGISCPLPRQANAKKR